MSSWEKDWTGLYLFFLLLLLNLEMSKRLGLICPFIVAQYVMVSKIGEDWSTRRGALFSTNSPAQLVAQLPSRYE